MKKSVGFFERRRGKMVKLPKKIDKVPWGIMFGISGIIAFYTLVGVIASHIILNSIAAQTSDSVAFLANWWQALLFAVSLLTAVSAIGSLVLYIIRSTAHKADPKETTGGSENHENG